MAETVQFASSPDLGRYKIRPARGGSRFKQRRARGYFVSPHEYEELQKMRGMRRRFLTAELSGEESERIAFFADGKISRRDHLNKLLDPK